MKLVVNGSAHEFDPAVTLAELVRLEQEPAGHVLVAVNGRFVPPAQLATRQLRDGDQIEIINPIFGG